MRAFLRAIIGQTHVRISFIIRCQWSFFFVYPVSQPGYFKFFESTDQPAPKWARKILKKVRSAYELFSARKRCIYIKTCGGFKIALSSTCEHKLSFCFLNATLTLSHCPFFLFLFLLPCFGTRIVKKLKSFYNICWTFEPSEFPALCPPQGYYF